MHHSDSEVLGDKKRDVAPAWYHQNNFGINLKLNQSNSASPYPRNTVPRRKARRKDEGPLAILCEWVVEHQIGEMTEPFLQTAKLIDSERLVYEPSYSSGVNPSLLPKGSQIYTQVFRAVILQP